MKTTIRGQSPLIKWIEYETEAKEKLHMEANEQQFLLLPVIHIRWTETTA